MGWDKYPIGTKAHAISGGYWEKVKTGWKWCTGSIFPTPGGDVREIEPPEKCEYYHSGYCSWADGKKCPDYLELDDDNGGACEKAL